MKIFYVYRSAVDGRFVTREYAGTHPDTTMRIKTNFGRWLLAKIGLKPARNTGSGTMTLQK